MNKLSSDLASHLNNDVTLLKSIKCILFKLSFQAIILYRLASFVRKTTVLVPLALVLDYLSSILTSCHISSKAEIGPGFNLPHSTGVVIGEGVVLGSNCTVYQGVTIGRKVLDVSAYPIVGDGVVIYPGSAVIGDIFIGDNAVIGANSTVMKDIPSGKVAAGSPAKVIRND